MTTQRPWIAYVGPVAFPDGGAAARRILGNAKALVGAGYDVTIVSGQKPTADTETFSVAPNIRCVSVNERDAEHLPKALRYLRYVQMGRRSRQWLDTQPNLPAAIIVYSGYTPYLLQLTGWAKRRGIPIIFDAVEWYTAQSTTHFLISPYLWMTEFAMRVLIPRCDGVIAISKALEKYYKDRGLQVCRVPPLVDIQEFTAALAPPHREGPLRLTFSGSTGDKELIDDVIAAVLAIDNEKGRLVLDIAGDSIESIQARAPIAERGGTLPACIQAHGRLSHAASVTLIAQADFTIFLRDINRVSNCGFPTKFVESLAAGTPVITNLTSDLSDHLSDTQTGLICSAPTVDALCATLQRALNLPADTRKKMRHFARREAEYSFDVKTHVELLGELINRVQNKLREDEQ